MIKKILPALVLIFLCNFIAYAQASVGGRVLDVLDGRTLVIETSAGSLTTQLQYVEVPDSGQPLFGVIKDHLAKLTVGKNVEIKPQRIVQGKTIGRMTLDGVDLSLQMIRDGAAWHEPKDTSGQHPDEAAEYEANQALAEREKRGVWSGAVIKTPWEVRAENEQRLRALDAARRISHPTLVGVGQFQSDGRRPVSGNHSAPAKSSRRSQMDAWVSVFAGTGKELYGIYTYRDPSGRFDVVYTSPAIIDLSAGQGKEKLECRALYVTMNGANGGRTSLYLVAFRAIAEDYRFSKTRTRLTARIDGQTLSLGSPFGLRAQGMIGSGAVASEELMYFKASYPVLKKIANARSVDFHINKFSGALPADSRGLFGQLAQATGR